MEQEGQWIHVAVDRPVDQLYTYRVPEVLRGRAVPGVRVRVPFGRAQVKGFVVEFSGPPPRDVRVKEVDQVLEEEPLVTDEVLGLLQWVARYYGCPLGEVLVRCMTPAAGRVRPSVVIKAVAPPKALGEHIKRIAARSPAQARILAHLVEAAAGVNRTNLLRMTRARAPSLKRLLEAGLLREVREDELPAITAGDPESGPVLNAAQRAAVDTINTRIATGGFAPFLLYGVTGSGKTEVYIQALKRVIEAGGQGLVLLPEIALTPQTYARFSARLPQVVLLHSLLPQSERTRNARAARRGSAKVVIGARSAVFAPFADLRLIVVDEEHETSFKADTAPRYHARDVAVVRAKRRGIPILLGSATPSLESYHNALIGRYGLLSLPERVTPRGLPHVRIVDLTRSGRGSAWLSRELIDLTAGALSAGRQALYFLNRRGYARIVKCLRCGYVAACQECSVSLTFHQGGDLLMCHTCGRVMPRPETCPQCGSPLLRFLGAGTQRIMGELQRRFPGVRIGRLDRDTASSRKSLLGILEEFSQGRLDLLVGTQMLAKGHDFPGVTLVGIICADAALHLPDFRAAERTFQLTHQVAGRAGRGEDAGIVVVQTYSPESRVIQLAVAGDYEGFACEEIARRRPLGYPPFGRVLRAIIRGKDEALVKRWAAAAADALRESPARILGPAPCTITRIRSLVRYQVIVKAGRASALGDALARLKGLRFPRTVEILLDVDPVSFL